MRPTLFRKQVLVEASKCCCSVVSVERQLRGGCQSRLVRCDDGNLYILKLRNNLQGPNVLANEWLGAALISALSVNTPKVAQIHLTSAKIRHSPLLKVQGHGGEVLPLPGYHFGSRLVGDMVMAERATDCTYGATPSNTTNLQDFAYVFLLDAWANTADRREVIFMENRGGTSTACFIDHGHMFGGPSWTCNNVRNQIYAQHYAFYRAALTSELIDKAISKMGIVLPKVFAKAMSTLPRSWYRDDIVSLQSFYMRRLQNLRRLIGAPALLRTGSEHLNEALRHVRLSDHRAFSREYH